MCLCDHESPVGNPLHNSKFKFRACPYRPCRSSLLYYPRNCSAKYCSKNMFNRYFTAALLPTFKFKQEEVSAVGTPIKNMTHEGTNESPEPGISDQ